jgi:alpha-L-fucosidase 2
MVFGGVARERIQLNEDTIWTGGQLEPLPAGASKFLPEIRRLLFEGKYAEGEAAARRHLLAGRRGDRNSYQTLGELLLTSALGEASQYRRWLDLDTASAITTFSVGAVKYRREVFSSAPDQVLVVRFEGDRSGAINLVAALERPEVEFEVAGPDTLLMAGQAALGDERRGVRFAAAMKAVVVGGSLRAEKNSLDVTGADSVTLILAAASDYNRRNPNQPLPRDLRTAALDAVRAAAGRPFADLKRRSVADHQGFFRRVALRLSEAPAPDLPTDERLKAVQSGAQDPALAALYFQYGRYLLICSSRPGDMPARTTTST